MFKDLKLKDVFLKDIDPVLECNGGLYRLYVQKYTHGSFKAIALECVGGDSAGPWADDAIEVEELFKVTALFDGVRHLEIKRSEEGHEGYIYYPNMEGLILMLSKVREIEVEHCRACG